MIHIKVLLNKFLINFSKAQTPLEQEMLEQQFCRSLNSLGKWLSNRQDVKLNKKAKGFLWWRWCPECGKYLKNTRKHRYLWTDFSVNYCPKCNYQEGIWHVAGD